MVKLRLRRKGRAHHPIYDIVAVDGRARRDGAFLERLGYFDPHHKPSAVKINHDRAVHWLTVGAQPTDVVRLLLSYDGVLLRKHLTIKGVAKEEIDAQVAKHQEVAAKRYIRRKELRVKRKENKIKAELAAKAAEEAAAAKAKADAEAAAAKAKADAEEAAAAAAAQSE